MPELVELDIQGNLLTCIKWLNKIKWHKIETIFIDENYYVKEDINRAGLLAKK